MKLHQAVMRAMGGAIVIAGLAVPAAPVFAEDSSGAQTDKLKAESMRQREAAAKYVDDSVITAKVKAALIKAPELKSLAVSVETLKGTVLLSGFVDDAKQRDKAMKVAGSVDGVVSVKDGMVLR